MTNLRRSLLQSILPLALWPLIFGCAQTLHNAPASTNPIAIGQAPSKDFQDADSEQTTPQAELAASLLLDASPDSAQSDDPAEGQDESLPVLGDTQNGAIDPAESVVLPDVPAKKIEPLLDEALDYCEASQEFWQKGELENAIDALDQAYNLILQVDTENSPKLIQQKEDLRFMISKRILEIYASRNIVVNGNFNAIPLVMNRHIQAELKLFTGREKQFFIEALKRSGKYRDPIVAALKASGLPEELSWLPLIESGFKVKALSRARALGLWQFIPSTGYKFGLKRDLFIDERIDPVKSTEAAIAYLKELHQIFGDWTTVLAAYNCGEGRVLRVIRDQNVNYLDNFWDLYERLPRETARYVPRFLATLHIINNPEKFGFDTFEVDKPLEFETITITKQVQLKDISKTIGAPETVMAELNPELRYKILPQDSYQLKIPAGSSELLLASLDDIPVSSPPKPAVLYHRVRRGETLSTIARKYRTSMSRIARANNISKKNYIVAGKILKIPQKGAYIAGPPTTCDTQTSASTIRHKVQRGDSLWNIANRYGTTTGQIQDLNKLRNSMLYIGQVLRIPGSCVQESGKTDTKTYLVKNGDSPFKIAQDHNMTVKRFLNLNQLSSNSKIYPGQKLSIE